MKQEYLDMFSEMERDAIGEIMNISMGSSATAVSEMLQKRTDITTPTVEVTSSDDFEISNMEPAIGVEIEYVTGIDGKNIFVLRKSDVKSIVETMLQMEIPDDEFELNELNLSAVCEVMNQMMGSASTALASLLGKEVDISPPKAYEIDDIEDIKAKYFLNEDLVAMIKFHLTIEDVLNSEFLSILPLGLAKDLIGAMGLSSDDIPEPLPEVQVPAPEPAPAPQPVAPAPEPVPVAPPVAPPPQPVAPPPVAQPVPQPMPQQAPTQYMAQQTMPGPENYGYAPQPRMISVQGQPSGLDYAQANLSKEEGQNLDMLMSVPLEISVEIGRARKPIKEIVSFQQGTLVVLDKLAGEQVDLYVNNQCIAKGDVVVVDDSFGIRITKILDKNDILNMK